MAIIKCKMCGGDLDVSVGTTVAECEYCGSKQTIPNQDNEKKLTLFARADRLRRACEFDKAAGVYENLVADFPTEAEAYWGLVLCRYGIEYVDDPATGKKVPTCHRSSFDSILEDADFDQTCENADSIARRVYRDEAKTIEDIRRGILEVSGKEEPYDIFICYKEIGEDGQRTLDSVLAQDVYDALTGRGYRVFFSRISLEDKLGTEYEPYIFAALNSAKIMLVFGTDYEHFNAVWVKNEWSRFLKLMAKDRNKHIIPCYKNLDAYDIPKELTKFQAQDMSKVGAMQDLLRGIEKLLPSKNQHGSDTNGANNGGGNYYDAETEQRLKRGRIHLEDGEWQEAYDCFRDAWCSSDSNYLAVMAHIGCICAEMQIDQIEKFTNDTQILSQSLSREQAICLAEVKAGHLWLEQGNWELANEHFGKALEENPECAPAYIGKLCIEMGCKKENDLSAGETPLTNNRYYKRAIQFADDEYRSKLESYNREILEKSSERKQKRLNEAAERRLKRVAEIRRVKACISAGRQHTLGLRNDGTVYVAGVADGGASEVEHWYDLIAVAAGGAHSVGLKADGSVVAIGSNKDGQCNTTDWKDIIEISAGYRHTVGLRKDGTVVAVGCNDSGECETKGWTDIVSISAGGGHTLGLKADGTVVAVGSNKYGQCNLNGVRDVVMVSAGAGFSVILKADGTVDACGSNVTGECNVKQWTGIAMIAAGVSHTVGLTNDGRVVIAHKYVDTGGGKYGLEADRKYYNASGWYNIVAIAAGKHTVGLISNGNVVAVGTDGFLDTKASTGSFKDVFPVEDELRIQASQRIELENRKKAQSKQWEAQGLCRYCGGSLGGLFRKKCKKCGKEN